ncbi:MAG TPA: FGGY family carbohydrate kinase [Kofleriaceae bacterium]|nr:FGGY family carbohydrate kinase [Kofleriaceae bacterium]
MPVVGIDLGTQSCKAVVCDPALAVLGDHQVGYPTEHPRPGWAEQDPARWEAALGEAIAGALAAAGLGADDVTALALAGQLDGCVAVDAAGAPVARALIWQDRRARADAAQVDRARLHAITGQVADPSHMAPKIRWLHGAGVRAARFHQPASYLVERLTGAAVIDPSHASTTMLCELATATWSRELCAAFAIDPGWLPRIEPTCAIAGGLHARGAALCGLRAGTPVAVGTGDDFATPLGAGIAAPGVLAVALGTAEVVGALSARPVLDTPAARTGAADAWLAQAEPMVETHAFPTGAWFVENPGWLSGGAVRWATRLLGLGADAELDALAAAAPPGADGVTFVPALAGAMTPVWRPALRGALLGLAAGHDRPHVARAVLEGLAFASRDVAQRLAALGVAARDAVVLGGGARSRTWMQLRADALGMPHHAAARADSCAVGAAMIAAVAVGQLRDLAAAAALAPGHAATFVPCGTLDEAYARYRGHVANLLSYEPA